MLELLVAAGFDTNVLLVEFSANQMKALERMRRGREQRVLQGRGLRRAR